MKDVSALPEGTWQARGVGVGVHERLSKPISGATDRSACPRVVTVVLNWNGLGDTIACLESLRGSAYPNQHVLVVDNGSTDGSAVAIRARFPEVEVVETGVNLGYTGGNNIGLRIALARGAAYAWLLNNDTIVEPDTLGTLVAVAETSPEAALLSPTIFLLDAPFEIRCAGVWVERSSCRVYTARRYGEVPEPGPRWETVVWGTALLVRLSVTPVVGLLDERYFAYHEDIDYSLRMTDAGYRNVVVPNARVRHKGAASSGGADSPTRCYYMTRNWFLLWASRTSRFGLPGLTRRYIRQALGACAECVAAGNLAAAHACLDGAWAALSGRTGERKPNERMPRWLARRILRHPYGWQHVVGGDVRTSLTGMLRYLRRPVQGPFSRNGSSGLHRDGMP